MISIELTDDQQEVLNTLLTIDNALVKKDTAVFEQLLAPDFIGTVPTGAFFTKHAYIEHHCHNNFGITSLACDNINNCNIRFYNDTAIVNRRVHAHFKLPVGNVVEYDVQRIEVLIKSNNQWTLVSGQGTQVIPIARPS